ncbi:MAG TPA: hypothetical protein VHI95_03395, partial [Acidimicrobiales bacterium]|nr:hypothetical protein [Acidimicrobiales bacterium]
PSKRVVVAIPRRRVRFPSTSATNPQVRRLRRAPWSQCGHSIAEQVVGSSGGVLVVTRQDVRVHLRHQRPHTRPPVIRLHDLRHSYATAALA